MMLRAGVVKDVVVVAGVPSPATDILNERTRAPKEMPPDDVRGYDVRTGQLLWTFHVVPRQGEFGIDTWEKDSWKYTGNTNLWSMISADEELGLAYFPLSSPTNDMYGGHRLGARARSSVDHPQRLLEQALLLEHLDQRAGKDVRAAAGSAVDHQFVILCTRRDRETDENSTKDDFGVQAAPIIIGRIPTTE